MSTLKETEARKRLIEESFADMYPEEGQQPATEVVGMRNG